MDIQQFNSKIVSITQVRRDIDVLNRILEKEDEAVVMKNQKVMFIAVKPERYKKVKESIKSGKFEKAMKVMESLRKKYKAKTELASDYVVKMREERVKKWKK